MNQLPKSTINSRLTEVRKQRQFFEAKYQMDFEAFKKAWEEGQIADKYTYDVERDYWLWEATITDEAALKKMLVTQSSFV
ncbi:MAG: hypothetical protein ACLFTI_13965 [Anaerolineales bacterium]